MSIKRIGIVELIRDTEVTWLHIKDSKGREALYNVEALAEKQSPMLGSILRQWADDKFNFPNVEGA
jgi:hypothetical protein